MGRSSTDTSACSSGILHWLTSLLFLGAAVAYCAAALLLSGAPALRPDVSGMLARLRPFLPASAPIAAALAYLWAERTISNCPAQRAVRALALVASAMAVVLLAQGFGT